MKGLSSLERIILDKKRLSLALLKVYTNKGLSPKNLMFFPGIPLDPPRAGIIAKIFI